LVFGSAQNENFAASKFVNIPHTRTETSYAIGIPASDLLPGRDGRFGE